MGATISFGVSAFLIVSLFSLRAVEVKRGRIFFAGLRQKADNLVLRVFLYIRRGVVREVKQDVKNMGVNMAHSLTLSALNMTRAVEERLIAFIAYMRRWGGRSRKVAEPSPFIKTVVSERREERAENR